MVHALTLTPRVRGKVKGKTRGAVYLITTLMSVSTPLPAADAPPEGFVRLVSADGLEYLVSRRHASMSKVLAAMLDGAFLEAHTRTVHLPISGAVLEKVCQYLYHAVRSQKPGNAGLDGSIEGFEVPFHLMKDVYNAALYLDL